MRTILSSVCVIALAGVPATWAQDKGTAANQSKEVQQDTKTTTRNGTTKTSADTATGKVESFEAGKSIKVTVPEKIMNKKSFDLDDKNTTVDIPSDVKVGEWVSVREKTDNNGHKTITVQRSSRH